jgi:hypothetical protein
MFRTVFPSIIRSSRLYTQHQVYVIQVSWLLASGKEVEWQFYLVSASKQSTHLVCTHRILFYFILCYFIGRTYCISWRYFTFLSFKLYYTKFYLQCVSHFATTLYTAHTVFILTIFFYISLLCIYKFKSNFIHSWNFSMTYTWSCIYSLGLLMMNGKTVWNM